MGPKQGRFRFSSALGLLALAACSVPGLNPGPHATYVVGGEPSALPVGWHSQPILPGLTQIDVPLPEAGTAESRLRTLAGVRFVERNQRMELTRPVVEAQADTLAEPPLRPLPAQAIPWNLKLASIAEAWSLTLGQRSLKVAVIDSGVDPKHPDLKGHLLPLIDVWEASEGSDLLQTDSGILSFDGMDGNGHGTHVAGILAATVDEQSNMSGVAPGVTVLPIKATDYQGNTSALTLAKAVKRAVDEGCKVLNISIGGPQESSGSKTLQEAIDYAINHGVVVVAATGNESDRRTGKVSPVTIPAAYPGVIAVAAVTEHDQVALYSNGGAETTIAAPGGGATRREGAKIRSTWPTYDTFESLRAHISGPYADLSGTSMACPHVSGAVALLLSQEPYLTPAQVKVRLEATADDVNLPGYDTASGYGRINVYRALRGGNDDGP